jgi:hypothetical protein
MFINSFYCFNFHFNHKEKFKFVQQATVASKFIVLTESVRDAADLYLSLKNPPVVFINDTPCGFVRHLECRDPNTAQNLWGNNAGCFEKPTLGKKPEQVQFEITFFNHTFLNNMSVNWLIKITIKELKILSRLCV